MRQSNAVIKKLVLTDDQRLVLDGPDTAKKGSEIDEDSWWWQL